MMDLRFPSEVEEITPGLLTRVMNEAHPGVQVRGVETLQVKRYGDGMVSTSGRTLLRLDYAPGSPDGLPMDVLVKMVIGTASAPAVMYENEVLFYDRLRPGLAIETPRCLGTAFDTTSGMFCVLLEDLGDRDARFPTAIDDPNVAQVGATLDTLADLHATFWQSPRFRGDLAWLQSHNAGELFDFFDRHLASHVEREIANSSYKAGLIDRIGRDPARLWDGIRAVHRHQATLPQTLLHGDAHVGNTYILPGGIGGLIDWQLMVRGAWVHDVAYFIVTALSIERRRRHDRDLLRRYLDRLAGHGVTAPELDEAWQDYAAAIVWGVTNGWLITPTPNYGDAILSGNLERLVTAAEDLDSFARAERLAA